LDIALSKGIERHRVSVSNVIDLCSDHCAVRLLVNIPASTNNARGRLFKKNTNVERYQHWLQNILDPTVEIESGEDLDDVIEQLNVQIHNAVSHATPPSRTNNRTPHRDVHLWSPEVAALVAEKRRLRRVWHNSRNPRDKTDFNRAAKELKELLSNLRRQSLEQYLAEVGPDDPQHNLWRITKSLKRPSQRKEPVRNANGDWCRSDSERAKAFAEHLHEAFSPFARCTQREANETADFLDVPCQMSLPIPTVESDELIGEISRLKASKSPGYDGIDVPAIKALPSNGVLLLLNITNKCFQLGHFPSQWKCAEVILIPKPGKPAANLASYRPISSRRILLRRVRPILDEAGLIPDHQFGAHTEPWNNVTGSLDA